MFSTTRARMSKKVAIVTGSSSGIGQGIAVELARLGYAVTLSGRNIEGLQKTREMCLEAGCSKEEVLIVDGDLCEEKVLINIAENTYSRFGRTDVLINNAGIAAFKDECLAVDAASFDIIYKVNLRAPLILSRHVIPALKETKGNIVNISSVGVNTQKRMMYSSMKAALELATASTAMELATEGVRVNCLRLGAMWTPIYEKAGLPSGVEESLKNDLTQYFHPVRRQMNQGDVNNALRYLLSGDSTFITGVVLPVSGGGHLPYDGRVHKYEDQLKMLGQWKGTLL